MDTIIKLWLEQTTSSDRFYMIRCMRDEATGDTWVSPGSTLWPVILVSVVLEDNRLKVREREQLFLSDKLGEIPTIKGEICVDPAESARWKARLDSVSQKAKNILEVPKLAAARLAHFISTSGQDYPLSEVDRIDYVLPILWPAWEARGASWDERARDIEKAWKRQGIASGEMLRKRASKLGLKKRAK